MMKMFATLLFSAAISSLASGALAQDASSATKTVTKTHDAATHSTVTTRSSTNAAGETATSTATRVHNEDGSVDRNVNGSGFKGQTMESQSHSVKTETGREGSGTWSNSAGKSGTTSSARVKTDTGHTQTNSAQNSAGETVRQRDAVVTRTENGVDRSVTRTGRKSARRGKRR